jgi:hypothetical protein
MKLIKSSKWIRLKGQMGPNNETCKIDTPVTDKERVFFIPETEDEKTFFTIDMALGLNAIPFGPTSHNPNEPWGWRFYANRNEDDMTKFAESIKDTMENVYIHGLAQIKNRKPEILN